MAEYVLKEQCKIFGDDLTDERIERKEGNLNDNVLKALNDHFTLDDLRKNKGKQISDTGLRMIISRWIKNKWVAKVGRGQWMKTEK
jgi:hypothetical protein